MELKRNPLLILIFLSLSPFFKAGPWHPDISHRPRVLFTASELNAIRSRLGTDPYAILWNNNFGEFSSIYTNGRQEIDSTANTLENPRAHTDIRSKISKDAAFVYALNKQSNGVDDLDDYTDDDNPWTRNEYYDHAIDYLENLDPTVNGPDNLFNLIDRAPYINNWQHRSEELILYCQAYDLLIGAGVAPDSTIEARISSLANNLLDRYTAHAFVSQYFLQRNNHKLHLAAALGTAAVTLNHNENAEGWINAAMVIIEWVLFSDPEEGVDGFRQIDDDGGYAEGPIYLRYAWKKLIPYFVAMKNFNGDWTETYTNDSLSDFYPDDPALTNIALRSPWFDPRYPPIYDWVSKIRMPEGRLPSIEDSQLKVYFPELTILGGYYSWPYQSYTNTYSKEYLLNSQLGTLKADYICAGNATEIPSPESWGNIQYLPEAGNLVFRSDWSTEAIYFHLNGKHGLARQAAAAHDQADVTNFTIGYKGKLLVMDAGYGGWADRYTVNQPENHNVILVNGYGPCPPSGPTYTISGTEVIFSVGDASPVDGYFQNLYTDTHFSYVELKSTYGQTYSRHEEYETVEGQQVWISDEGDSTSVDFTRCLLFVDNRYFIMLDNIDNQHPNQLQYTWLLHANGGQDTGGLFQSLPAGGIITQENANLLSYTTAIGGLDSLIIEQSHHAAGHGPENLENHTLIKAVKNAVDTRFLSVLYPFEDSPPEIISISSEEFTMLVVARILIDDNRYEIILSQNSDSLIAIPEHTAGSLEIPSIETRANFLVISLDALNPDPSSIYLFGTGSDTVIIGGVLYDLPVLKLDHPTSLPGQFILHPVYPNPFNLNATIRFELPESAFVRLVIYDLLGREVALLVNGFHPSGFYELNWSASSFASGIYICRLSAGSSGDTRAKVLSRKLVLIK